MALSDAERKARQRAREAGLAGRVAPSSGPVVGRDDLVLAWAEGVWLRQAGEMEGTRLLARDRQPGGAVALRALLLRLP